ncbi:bifunctional serine/threonine-protein kinase/formylglycine-generating enzyme family protein [Thalassoglobus polymorphus]|uniref:Serine/threonine-protein kinase PknH n=1 Tax=Thalassoglobus polymorphus TaxID=2527994 RepID=A0A517QGN2_9PLAN|nr:bifunctional serine/threonine-protein kinase/formylglycine-generating enzyme family protein [Thalassoglobus polymorphus]QDT30781.1 Serine/threonine-protein kinase PknH [Thalassoglobus polymorphus]
MNCPSDLQLSEFLKGRLEEELSLQVEQHFEVCEECPARIASLDLGSHTISMDRLPEEDSNFDFVNEPECLQLQLFAKDLTHRAWPYGETSTIAVLNDGNSHKLPERIGHFRVLDRIGAGSFGVVLKCWDEHLDRPVAIKVSHPSRVKSESDAERYRLEAKLLAKMGHPNIVPVHASGLTDDGQVYIISRYIQGRNLAEILKVERFQIETAVRLVAKIAEAIHHMHTHGILHRDIKPGNILIDVDDIPYVTDFGLAIHEDEVVRNREVAGTLAYMSPEQLSGDGHLIVARSDIFSLGVVLFEMLTGVRPFGDRFADNSTEWMRKPPVPSDFEPNVPVALDRICSKALQRRSSERHSSARELQIELEKFLENPAAQPESEGQINRVYRGLRAFRKDDAEFFSELLPGQLSSEGHPQQVQYWLNRMDGRDPDCEPRIGVIYGATGSGKSSLVNAALVPKLAGIATPVLIQASEKKTEIDLAAQLKKVFLDLEAVSDLPEMTRRIRKRPLPHANQKVVIVIDQFEQWLQGRQIDSDQELVQALRQCDGHSIQCLLIVRDDYWVELSQFMRVVEASLNEGDNAMAVPEFTIEHAKTVLTKFGTLLKKGDLEDPEKAAFIERGVELIQSNGRVAPVWLALFVEITKELPWSSETIGYLDDFKALGRTYLRRRFDPEVCPRRYRPMIPAIKKLLSALLPEQGNNLKGQGLNFKELQEVCGYENKPQRFAQLIETLDSELRIISPIHQDGDDDQDLISYQLTHDYLVPSIRSWLEEEELQTHAGRARQKLRNHASLWSLKKEARQLPGLFEVAYIRSGTLPAEWSSLESEMMKTALRKIATRTLTAAILLAVLGTLMTLDLRKQRDTELLVQLKQANIENVPMIVDAIEERLPRMKDQVFREFQASTSGSASKARLALLLLNDEEEAAAELKRQLPESSFENFRIFTALLDEYDVPLDSYTDLFRSQTVPSEMRFQAACALLATNQDASLHNDETQVAISEAVVDGLIAKSGVSLETWTNWLSPYQEHLTEKLTRIFDAQGPQTDLNKAAFILSIFLRDDPATYSELLLRANDEQLSTLIDGIIDIPEAHLQSLDQKRRQVENNPESLDQKSKTNLLAAFVHLGETDFPFPYFRRQSDPSLRSELVHKLAGSRVNPERLLPHLKKSDNPDLTAGLLQVLGSLEPHHFTTAQQNELKQASTKLFIEDPDPEVHSSSQWVLKKFGETPSVPSTSARDAEKISQGWYSTESGFTMIVPPAEHRTLTSREKKNLLSVNWTFGISSTEVTVKDFCEYQKNYESIIKPNTSPDSAAGYIEIRDAMEYCNWLTKRSGMGADDLCYEVVRNYLQPRPDYLQRKGYRLPTEREWELATRSGSRTFFHFGSTDELINHYAWHIGNSNSQVHPVGLLKPNQLGLFDVSGNIGEWCHNHDDVVRNLKMNRSFRYAIPFRGGTFQSHLSSDMPIGSLKSESRIVMGQGGTFSYLGFRIARTLSHPENPQ